MKFKLSDGAFCIAALLVLLISTSSLAQKAHNTRPNSQCRFVKGPKNHEGMTPCDACFEQRKKDEAAVKAEYDKRMKDNKAESAKQLQARLDDLKQKNAAEKKAREAQAKNVVTFALPQNNHKSSLDVQTKVKAESKPSNSQKGDYLYVVGNTVTGTAVINGKGDTVLKKENTMRNFFGLESNKDNLKNFPKDMVIAELVRNNCSSCRTGRDLLNSQGNRYFNDNSIDEIKHIRDGFFLVLYHAIRDEGYMSWWTTYDKAAIYNVADKSFLILDDRVNYKNESFYLKVSDYLSRAPKLPIQDSRSFDSWNENMGINEISDYAVLGTGPRYPGAYAVYFVNKLGKIERKEFIFNWSSVTVSEVR